MHNVQLFVEDQLNEAYEIMAAKAMGLNPSDFRKSGGPRIRAARVGLNELTDVKNLLDLTQRAQRSGRQQVVFVIDHEGPGADDGRIMARQQFREAFRKLCDYIEQLPDNDPLKQVSIVRVEARSCLEAWLLSDPQGIVQAFSGPSNYCPNHQQTEYLSPRQARDKIAHIVREIGKRKGNRRLAKMRGRAIKSWSKKIALHIDLAQGSRYNFSLNYFYESIRDNRNGCQYPFPD